MTDDNKAQSAVGVTLGNVRLTGVLGQGGMGTVYRGEHIVLQTPFAVKVLHPELSRDAVLNERFRREAIVCSRLRHPNIVFLTDFGYHEELGLYIVMEFLEGCSLFEEMQKQALALWRVIAVAQQVCEALAAAHEHQVLHRDLKPENIFLVQSSSERPVVKVLDFGIARLLDQEAPRLTEEGMVMGTPEYLAPEHIQGGNKANPTSDLYSMGIILFEMLTHRFPFDGGKPMEVFSQHVMAPPRPLSAYRPNLAGTQLERLILELLAKLPRERPASAKDVVERLASALDELQQRGLAGASPPPTPGSSSSPPERPAPTVKARLQGTLKLMQHPTQHTQLTQFFQMLPGLSALPPDLFFSASWGLLLQDLRDSAPGSDTFEESTLFLARLLDDLLQGQNLSEEPNLQRLIKRALVDLTKLLDEERQRHVMHALQTGVASPHLAEWLAESEPSSGGSQGGLRGFLQRDVRDFFRKGKD